MQRLLVMVGVMFLFVVFTLVSGAAKKPWRWSILLPFAIMAYFLEKCTSNDLVGGGLMLFALCGFGFGILGLTHLGNRE